MIKKDMKSLFASMRGMFRLTREQSEFSAHDWSALLESWCGVFAADRYEHVWAGVRMYARNGGVYWPYPGEIADMMPAGDWYEDKALRDLSFRTRARQREIEARMK